MKPSQLRSQVKVLSALIVGVLVLAEIPMAFAQAAPADVETPTTPAEPKPKRPSWADVEKTVKSTLAQTKGYQPGDVIAREEALAALKDLKKLGWDVKEQNLLTDKLLPLSDDMVKQLRSKQGMRFMREISGAPEGYDRLDRLRKLPYGQRRLKELIHDPGGYTLIQYMATTPGGKNMGRQLSSATRGNFNAATNRIYTESQLLAELKNRYEAESASLMK